VQNKPSLFNPSSKKVQVSGFKNKIF